MTLKNPECPIQLKVRLSVSKPDVRMLLAFGAGRAWLKKRKRSSQ